MPTETMTRAQVIDLLHHIKNELDSRIEEAEVFDRNDYDAGINSGLIRASGISESVLDTAIKSVESGELS